MTNKQRLETIFCGGTPDRTPFAPFAELMPRGDFVDGLIQRGMGLIAHASSAASHSPGVAAEMRAGAGFTEIIRRTPRGDLISTYNSTKERITGNELGVQTGFPIKGPEDYEAAVYAIDSTVFNRDTSGYENTIRELGDNGVPHCWTGEPPYMGAQYWLGLEAWSYHQFDYPGLFRSLLEALGRQQERLLSLLLDCPDNLVNLGNLAGNFGPKDFEKHMLPYFQKYAVEFRKRGKLTTIHADANNLRIFKELVAETGVDIVEAFTPPPFGDLSLAEARKAWGEKTTIWINFPETVFYGGYEETKRYTIALLGSDPCPNKFLSLTEMGLLGVNDATESIFRSGILAILDAIDAISV